MRLITLFWALLAGSLFGVGLAVSHMIRPELVLSFLRFQDFGLPLVLAAATSTALLVYQLAPRRLDKPWFGRTWGKHPAEWNARTFWGSALFGIGWGLTGVCPGPAIAGLGAGNWPLLMSLAGLLAGAWVHGRYFGR